MQYDPKVFFHCVNPPQLFTPYEMHKLPLNLMVRHDCFQESEDGYQEAQSSEDLIPALQQFMEGSPVGEYETRLQLLLSFHCHAVHMEQSQQQGG